MDHSQEQMRLRQIEERLTRIEQHLIVLDEHRQAESSPSMIKSFVVGFLAVLAVIIIILALIGVVQYVAAG